MAARERVLTNRDLLGVIHGCLLPADVLPLLWVSRVQQAEARHSLPRLLNARLRLLLQRLAALYAAPVPIVLPLSPVCVLSGSCVFWVWAGVSAWLPNDIDLFCPASSPMSAYPPEYAVLGRDGDAALVAQGWQHVFNENDALGMYAEAHVARLTQYRMAGTTLYLQTVATISFPALQFDIDLLQATFDGRTWSVPDAYRLARRVAIARRRVVAPAPDANGKRRRLEHEVGEFGDLMRQDRYRVRGLSFNMLYADEPWVVPMDRDVAPVCAAAARRT